MENSFNINLRRIRKEKGITQEQLAEKVGVSPQAVSKWEISSYPDPQLLPAIADFLGVTIDKLYGRGDDEISLNQRVIEKTYSGPYTDEAAQGAYQHCCAPYTRGGNGLLRMRTIYGNPK